MTQPIYLGVNVDHVATIRQARGVRYPCPVHAALQAELAGADGITMHLREDRRHIQDADVERYFALRQTKLNFEMAATDEMRDIALSMVPEDVCLVPEKREELTTEGGLDVRGQQSRLKDYVAAFSEAGIHTSMFIDPDAAQIDACVAIGAPVIELHTGAYAECKDTASQQKELVKIQEAAAYAHSVGLVVNAGHGLTRDNVAAIAAIENMNELNIGHSLIADAVMMGLPQAVKTMKACMLAARSL